jgi:hypothetical protein
MAYRSITDQRFIRADPASIWPYLAEPRKLAGVGDHPVEIESAHQKCDGIGDTWVEVHGAECDHQRVPWRVISAEYPRMYRCVGRQIGIKQTVEFTVTPVEDGSLVRHRIVFSPTLTGRSPEQLLTWLMLATGLLARVAKGMSDALDDLQLAADAEGADAQPDHG